MNVFGKGEETGLSNPLTEDLLAGQFNLLDVNEIHLNEIHDQDGAGPIVVHESLNMTNSRITNMADPVAGKDAVTLGYAESNFASQAQIPDTAPYDLYFAVTDETNVIPVGTQPIKFYVPRNMVLTSLFGYLSVAPTTSTWTVTLSINGTTNLAHVAVWASGDIASSTYTFPTPLNIYKGDLLEFIVTPGDTTTAGLKMVLAGLVDI